MMRVLRGAMASFSGDPFLQAQNDVFHYLPDALIVMENGHIMQVGNAAELLPALPAGIVVETCPDSLILPGFVDCHVHYPQTGMMAAFGEQLIDWLNHYTFVEEQAFVDADHARQVARVFLDEQMRHGVTTGCVFGTVHPQSVEALFAEAQQRGLRLAAGKVCMDRNAPGVLLDTPQRAYDESRALIERWHGQGRLEYAITPRFAPTSSTAQLEWLGSLAAEHPDVLIQSHVSENLGEIAWVESLFPGCRDYADVYARHGLLRPRAVYGHGIHLSEPELEVFHAAGASLAHCPTSNFFLGSGCFDVKRGKESVRPVTVGLATDIGAGTSFSMLQTMAAAYQAAQFNGHALTAPQAYYLATRGSAEALGLAGKVGSIEPGMEADLVVLDLKATPLLAWRMQYARGIEDAMFILMMMGDDRAVGATWVAGEPAWRRPAAA